MSPRIVTSLLLLTLGGCSAETPESMLEDYLQRVSNSLDHEIIVQPAPSTLLLPKKRDRRAAVIDIRTGLLDTLDFSLCELLPLIAERNSSLGRVMQPSMTMSYELKFFARLQPCYLRDQIQPLKDQEFSDLLADTYRIKQSNLKRIVWNGIFTSEALERNLSLSADPVLLSGNPGYGDSVRALNLLQHYRNLTTDTHYLDNPFERPDSLETIEQHYQALHNSRYGSELFQSLVLLTRYLNQTAATLEAAMNRRPICFSNKPTPKAKILKNVFNQYYATRVQPYMSMIQRQGQPWLSAMNRLMETSDLPLAVSIDAYRHHMINPDSNDSLWGHYQLAIKRHTKAWQDLLGQCGLMPQSSSL